MRVFTIGDKKLTAWDLLTPIVEGTDNDLMGIDIAIDEFIAFQYDRAKWLKIDDLIYACSLVLRKAEANYNLHDILA